MRHAHGPALPGSADATTCPGPQAADTSGGTLLTAEPPSSVAPVAPVSSGIAALNGPVQRPDMRWTVAAPLRLRAAPTALATLWRLMKTSFDAWLDDYAPSMGAALAFYTLFSIAPLLLIVISVAGLLFGEPAARAEIMAQLAQLAGAESARTIGAVLESLNRPQAGAVGTVVGVGVLVVGATTVFAELQTAMDRIWRAPPLPAGGGVLRFLRVRLLSLSMVLGLGFLLMVSLVVSAALAALGKWWAPWFGEVRVLATALDLLLSFAFLATVFAMIYKWMPRVAVAWRDVWLGAAITATLFTLGKSLIGIYIGRSGVASVFGAAGSLVVLLLWVYYSAQVFLLGAEFTSVYAREQGSLRRPPPPSLPPARVHLEP